MTKREATMNWRYILNKLIEKEDLTLDESYWVMNEIMCGNASDVKISALLSLLASKSESSSEIAGFAKGMIEHAVRLENIEGETLDIVGTGGDYASSVNISSMASVVIAAAGIKVLKHGNRASSSLSGSADMLQSLGVKLDLSPQSVVRLVNDIDISFAFAQVFHPAMKFVSPVRKELGFHTIFNLLGPLTNPSNPKYVVIGVANEKYAKLIAEVFASRNQEGFVFNGNDENGNGLDELAATAHGLLYEIRDGKIKETLFDPSKLKDSVGLEPIEIADLKGGSASHNANITTEVFSGLGADINDTKAQRAIFQTVILNAAAGIVAQNMLIPESIKAKQTDAFDLLDERFVFAYNLAKDVILEGKAKSKLDDWIRESNREC